MPERYGEFNPELPELRPIQNVENFDDLYSSSQEGPVSDNTRYDLPPLRWIDENVDVEQLLSTGRKLIEVAGPTPAGFELIDGNRVSESVLTSNKDVGLFARRGNELEDIEKIKIGDVDFVADGAHLPIADDSVGALFATGVPSAEGEGETGLRFRIINEARRVLNPGGFLIWQGGRKEDVQKAISAGFKPVRAIVHPLSKGDVEHWSFVFQKTQ